MGTELCGKVDSQQVAHALASGGKKTSQLLEFRRQLEFSKITHDHQEPEGHPGRLKDLNVKSIKTKPLQAAAARNSTTSTSAPLKWHS